MTTAASPFTSTTPRRIVVLGPHPDDQELGMGGAIIRLASLGHPVLLLDLTDGEPTPLGDHHTRRAEAANAASILRDAAQAHADRAHADQLHHQHHTAPTRVILERACLGLPNRALTHDLRSRHLVAAALRAWRADILFAPAEPDAHPDHVACAHIARDARFDAKLSKADFPAPTDIWTNTPLQGPGVLPDGSTAPHHPRWLFGYFATHLRAVPRPDFLLDVTGHEPAKVAAINAYRTQFVLPEHNRRIVRWVESALDYFGSRAGTTSAEPFASPEPLSLTALSTLC